jgi:hypothetical protein
MILLSPAKTQDFTTPPDTDRGVVSAYLRKAKVLRAILTTYSQSELSTLMGISDSLATLNHTRFKNWSDTFNLQKTDRAGTYNFKQAIFAFRGDVYTAFEHNSFTAKEFTVMEKEIRIISGLYGLLTPLTYIKPYRLEMKTALPCTHNGQTHKNLYEYWRQTLTKDLALQLKKDEIIINLASKEYAKAIDFSAISNTKIDIEFKNIKNGVPKIVALFAKRQRGEMAVWAIKHGVKSVADIKKYTHDGYKYSAALSHTNNLVFIKPE